MKTPPPVLKRFNTNGAFNTASGLRSLPSNTTGSANMATGTNALLDNTSGNNF